jgi:reticulon-4-interacting protein 1, mitochondrial
MTVPTGSALPPIPSGATLILEDRVVLKRPAADVWAFVRDMENYPLWFAGIVRMQSADTLPIATVGKRYDEVAIAPGGKEETICVGIIAADDERQHLAIAADLAPFLPRFDYRVVPVAADRCVYHWRSVATGQSFKAVWQRPIFRMILRRRLATSLANFRRILAGRDDEVMRAALFWRFGPAPDVVRLYDRAPRPQPRKGEVLVRQCATSINQIDCHRRQGYGRNAMRARGALNFPITLGNDVAGEIVALGKDVKGLRLGDAVLGVKPPSSDGTFAEFVAVKANSVIVKPDGLDFEQAAALPYTFFTAWAALSKDGGLTRDAARGKRVFVQGGAGGVGSMAVQIARFLGAEVIASCGPGQRPLVELLGADAVYDYTSEDISDRVRDVDIALCTASAAEEDTLIAMLKPGGRYVTVIHPTLAMTDELGLLKGFLAAKRLLKAKNRALAGEAKTIGWTLFKADAPAFALLRDMLDAGALRPVVDSVFAFEEIIAAQQRLESGDANGKVVVRFGP